MSEDSPDPAARTYYAHKQLRNGQARYTNVCADRSWVARFSDAAPIVAIRLRE